MVERGDLPRRSDGVIFDTFVKVMDFLGYNQIKKRSFVSGNNRKLNTFLTNVFKKCIFLSLNISEKLLHHFIQISFQS